MSYFIDICLICLEHSNNLISIKSQDTNGTSFESKLEDFLPEYGLNLEIPAYICAKCGRKLNKIHEFKQICLRNKTTYKKYAQQITTKDGCYKYLSVMLSPDFMCVKEEIFDENIQESPNEICFEVVNSEEWIIKEETKELVLDDNLTALLHEVEEIKPESDATCNQNEQNVQISPESLQHLAPEKSFTCEVCSKSFRWLSSLNSHKVIHTGEKPYTCEVCGKSFPWPASLKVHELTHSGKKPFTCDVCNKPFAHSSHLKIHKLRHTGEKPFICDVCNKSFGQSSHLKGHKLLHTGEKPFTCDICNTSFRHSNSLKKHKITHIGENTETYDNINI